MFNNNNKWNNNLNNMNNGNDMNRNCINMNQNNMNMNTNMSNMNMNQNNINMNNMSLNNMSNMGQTQNILNMNMNQNNMNMNNRYNKNMNMNNGYNNNMSNRFNNNLNMNQNNNMNNRYNNNMNMNNINMMNGNNFNNNMMNQKNNMNCPNQCNNNCIYMNNNNNNMNYVPNINNNMVINHPNLSLLENLFKQLKFNENGFEIQLGIANSLYNVPCNNHVFAGDQNYNFLTKSSGTNFFEIGDPNYINIIFITMKGNKHIRQYYTYEKINSVLEKFVISVGLSKDALKKITFLFNATNLNTLSKDITLEEFNIKNNSRVNVIDISNVIGA